MGSPRRGSSGERAAERGFTLIEIMIVIAIIGLVASFALPALRDARLRANETAAIGMMRSLHTAQGNYKRQGLPSQALYRGYAHYLSYLTEAGLHPGDLRKYQTSTVYGEYSGYQFYTHSGHTTAADYWQRMVVLARPLAHGKTGQKAYLMTEEGHIYYKDSAGWILKPSQGKLLGGG